MRRRNFLALVGGAALCRSAWAQAPRAPRRIGFLTIGQKPDEGAPGPSAFLNDLAKFGYTRGQNLAIEYRYAEWNFDRLPGLAAELVDLHVDIIVARARRQRLRQRRRRARSQSSPKRWAIRFRTVLSQALPRLAGTLPATPFLVPSLWRSAGIY